MDVKGCGQRASAAVGDHCLMDVPPTCRGSRRGRGEVSQPRRSRRRAVKTPLSASEPTVDSTRPTGTAPPSAVYRSRPVSQHVALQRGKASARGAEESRGGARGLGGLCGETPRPHLKPEKPVWPMPTALARAQTVAGVMSCCGTAAPLLPPTCRAGVADDLGASPGNTADRMPDKP